MKNNTGVQIFTEFKLILTGKETPIVSLIREFDASQYLMKEKKKNRKSNQIVHHRLRRMIENDGIEMER